jgi:hypothetical protein
MEANEIMSLISAEAFARYEKLKETLFPYTREKNHPSDGCKSQFLTQQNFFPIEAT